MYKGGFIKKKKEKSSRSAISALTILALNVNCNGKLVNFTSSTMAEETAITQVLPDDLELPIQDVVLLTDSRAAT